MLRTLLLVTLVTAPALAAPDDVFSSFDAWAVTWRGGARAQRENEALRRGVDLARARRDALQVLMQTEPERAIALMRPRVGLPPAVASLMELELDTPARVEVRCEYGRPLVAELVLGSARLSLPSADVARFDSTREVHVSTWTLGTRAVITNARGGARNPEARPWTVGNKRVLYIRVDFSDDPGAPIDVMPAQTVLTQLDGFLRAASYNRTSVTGTVTPMVVRVPDTKASYGASNNTSKLLNDGRAAARAAGYDPSLYDLDVVVFRRVTSFGWAGLGSVGGKGVWINGAYGLDVLAHEVGHNLGLNHANFWLTADDSIIGAGSSQEYGNPFDIMGGGTASRHYNAWYKKNLDWFNVPEWDSVSLAAQSGTFRLSDLEQPILGGLHSVRVPISGSKDYWVEFRAGAGPASVLLFWGYPAPQASLLLDMVPWTSSASDAPLTIGRTFSDFGSGIHITPTAVVPGSPSAIDVVINRGTFQGNHAPTVTLMASATQGAPGTAVAFTAMASDPDSDPLAYAWDFGDGSPSTNVSTTSRSFPTARDVLARITVSDMKGHTATAAVIVRVGAVSTARVSGHVTDNGVGVEGVRVVGGSRQTFTNSDGTWTLVGVTPGPLTLNATKAEYTLSALFTNPVTVLAGGSSGNDFTATRAVFGVFGRVSSVGQGVPNVTVSAGPYTTLTGATGDFALPVPNGLWTVAVQAPGQVFKPVGWTNPVQVNGVAATGKNFAEDVVPVSGTVAGEPGPHSVTDGVHTVQTMNQAGAWVFTLPRVGPGTWNLVATASGQIITPMFTNPVTVASTPVSGLVFSSSSGTAWNVSGVVDELGSGLSATNVTATFPDGGVATSLTDTRGRYVLVNLTDGALTVAPSRSGYTFGPASRAVSISGADVTQQDFSVVGANAPPVILIPPSATPFPVSGTTAGLFVLGDDPAPGDEGALTYTWTQTLGPATAGLSTNGSNASKNTTATFTKAGAYGFRVEVKDPGNLKVSAELSVVVQQTATTVKLTPSMAAVDVGATKQFVAAGADQFGESLGSAAEVTWEVMGDCGTVSASGRFTATKTGQCDVVATVGGLSGRAPVTVVVGAIPRVITGPTVTPSPVIGARARGSVIGTDDDGEAQLTYTWTAMSPPATVTFTPNGSNAAKDTVISFGVPGTYVLSVELKDARENTAVEFVTVEVRNGAWSVLVSPAAASVVVGATQAYSAAGRDAAGQPADVGACTWSATGGTIDATGTYTAGAEPGEYAVTATCGLNTGATSVKVTTTGAGGGMGGGKSCGCGETSAIVPLLALLAGGARRKRTLGARP